MRHQIASEMWEALNRFHLELQRRRGRGATPIGPVGIENAHLFYRSVAEFSHLFQGVTDSTMPREEGWYFLQAGKFLERAEKTARALDVKYHLLVADADPDAPVAGPGFAEAAQRGRRRRRARRLAPVASRCCAPSRPTRRTTSSTAAGVRPRSVVEMLTLSPVFPRSIRFSIGEVESALARIAAYRAFDPRTPASRGTRAWAASSHLAGRSRPSRSRADSSRRSGPSGGCGRSLPTGWSTRSSRSACTPTSLDLQRRCYTIGEHIQAQYFAPRILRPEEVVA